MMVARMDAEQAQQEWDRCNRWIEQHLAQSGQLEYLSMVYNRYYAHRQLLIILVFLSSADRLNESRFTK
jgi:hypothetical protein